MLDLVAQQIQQTRHSNGELQCGTIFQHICIKPFKILEKKILAQITVTKIQCVLFEVKFSENN